MRSRRSCCRGLGSIALLAGATAELAGIQSVFQTGWRDVLSVDASSAPMMRLLAGVLVLFGISDGTSDPADERADADRAEGADERSPPHGVLAGIAAEHRWAVGADSSFGLVGLALGVLSFSFDGHTVTRGPRGVHVAANVVHVTAGAVWFGGIVALVVVAVLRRRTGPSIAGLVVRFSSVASIALGVRGRRGCGDDAVDHRRRGRSHRHGVGPTPHREADRCRHRHPHRRVPPFRHRAGVPCCTRGRRVGRDGARRFSAVAAERILAAFRDHAFVGEQRGPVPIGASIGVATYPADGRTATDLISAADQALYRVKREGGHDAAGEHDLDAGRATRTEGTP